MTKVSFFYATGTSYVINMMDVGIRLTLDPLTKQFLYNGKTVFNPPSAWPTSQADINALGFGEPAAKPYAAIIPGLDGRTAAWAGSVYNDPFPRLLDPEIWDASRIEYPAAMLDMGTSIDFGITQTIKAINALPPGQPFAIGGQSQGAAVMSGVYNEIKNSGGSLTGRASSFLGGVCFGNPRRQVNFRGDPAIAGSWSGGWGATQAAGYRLYRDPTSNNSGSGGSFPSTGKYARLQGCDPNKWLDFAMPSDIIGCTGTTPLELNWHTGNGLLLGVPPARFVGKFLLTVIGDLVTLGFNQELFNDIKTAFAYPPVNYFIDGAGHTFKQAGGGHAAYPALPPPANNGVVPLTTKNIDGIDYLVGVGDTCYQVAMKWLNSKAKSWATAPIMLSSTSAGWSTTLVPPGS